MTTYLLCGWILGLMFGWFGAMFYDKCKEHKMKKEEKND